jgi:hypothetical protein
MNNEIPPSTTSAPIAMAIALPPLSVLLPDVFVAALVMTGGGAVELETGGVGNPSRGFDEVCPSEDAAGGGGVVALLALFAGVLGAVTVWVLLAAAVALALAEPVLVWLPAASAAPGWTARASAPAGWRASTSASVTAARRRRPTLAT